MTKAARKAGSSAALPKFEQFEDFAAFNDATAEALAKARRVYVDALGELNGELSGFFTKRLDHDMELSRSVTGCKDWQELAHLQQDWAREAMEEYLAEATKLMQLYSKASMEGWQTFYGQARSGSKALTAAGSEPAEQRARAA